MALSGSSYVSVGSGWRLQIEWTATQSISANESTVKANLYWISEGSQYSVNSSSTKSCSITINGGTASTKSAGGMADLNGGQKKLIHTFTKDVAHNDDGTKPAFNVSGTFDMEVTLSGTYYSSKTATDSVSLTTIPRKSTMSSSIADWKAGSDKTISFSRYSSSFNHIVKIYVGNKATDTWNWIKDVEFTTSQTSKSTSFTTAEKKDIFSEIGGASSKDTHMILQTYKGTDWIGSNYYYGTVTSPDSSEITVPNFTLGNNVTMSISEEDGEFEHTIVASIGSWSKTLTSLNSTTNSVVWNTATDMTSVMGQIGSTSKTGTVTFTITTYYDGVKVRANKTDTATATIPSSQSPTWTTYTNVTWADSNPTTNGIKGTGNEAYIIQGQSKLKVTFPTTAQATPKTGTTMKTYSATVNGYTQTVNYSAGASVFVEFPANQLNVGTNQKMTIKATDARGLSTSYTRDVLFVPYSAPVLIAKAFRNNGFDNPSTVSLSGSVSPVNVNSANKNTIKTYTYQWKIKGASDTTYSTATPFSLQAGTAFPNFKVTDITDLDFDQTKSYTIKFNVSDSFGSVSTTKDIATGVPVMFIDSKKKSVGVGKMPTGDGTFEVNGTIVLQTNKYSSSGGGLDAKNADMVGLNTLYFADSVGSNEGLMFPFSNATDVLDRAQNDNVRALDGKFLFNDYTVHHEGNMMVARGSVSLNTVSSNVVVQTAVSFGKTFPGTPSIQLTANSGSSNVMKGIMMGSTGASATGFTLTVAKEVNGAVGIIWVAIWEG